MSPIRDALRRRVDIKPAKHRTRPLLTGSIVIGLIVFALLSAALRHVPGVPRGGHEISAEFKAANQVSGRTVVRVGGVEVGRVSKVAAGGDPSRATRVTMRITDNSVKLHSDARANVRWRTLFGGLMYIDLDPGSKSAPALGDRPIPVSQTSNQVELDQFLQPYDGSTDERQRKVIQGLSDVFTDPSGVQHTLRSLPVLRTVARGLQPVRGQQSDDLSGLVAAAAKTVDGLNDTTALQTLVTGASTTLGVTDARRADLGALLELSPPSLDSTLTTMTRLRTTLNHLDPLAAQLRPGARALGPAARAATPAFRQTEAVLHEIHPLLRAARPTFRSLRGVAANGVPLMEGLDPTLDRLDNELLPYLRKKDDETRLPLYETIGPFWAALAMSAAEYDSEGHRIRFTVPPNTNSYVNSAPAQAISRACQRSSVAASRCGGLTKLLVNGWFGHATVKDAR
jgi:ABC-type transporter Mla subunit MlaD